MAFVSALDNEQDNGEERPAFSQVQGCAKRDRHLLHDVRAEAAGQLADPILANRGDAVETDHTLDRFGDRNRDQEVGGGSGGVDRVVSRTSKTEVTGMSASWRVLLRSRQRPGPLVCSARNSQHGQADHDIKPMGRTQGAAGG